MFEGPKLADRRNGSELRGQDAGRQLHALSWSDLVARFAAAADLRRMLADASHENGGSFAEHAGRTLGGAEECIPSVNPNALGKGKSGNGMETVVGQSQTGDRGRE